MHVEPRDFKSERPPRRIIGTEAEHTAQNVLGNGTVIPLEEYISDEALAQLGLIRHGYFLNNGGKLHIDGKKKIEYCTPEEPGPRMAALQDAYGTELVRRVVDASGQPHRGIYRTAGTFLDKGDPGYDPRFGSTSGFHHNYLTVAKLNPQLVATVLGAHLATRVQAWGGALQPQGFVLSQKIWSISRPVEIGHHTRIKEGEKPLAAILRQDHATVGDTKKWMRVEDLSPDPSCSIEITEDTLAELSLVLRLLENARKLGGGRRIARTVGLRNPVAAARQFAGDLSLQSTTKTVRGKRVHALDVQEELALLAAELSGVVQLPPDEHRAIKRWVRTVDALRASSPLEGHYTPEALELANFALRHQFLLNKSDTPERLRGSNPEDASRDLLWDRILPEGYGMQAYRRIYGMSDDTPWADEPPLPQTRAMLRALLLNDPRVVNAGWSSVEYKNNGRIEKVSLADPYQTSWQTT